MRSFSSGRLDPSSRRLPLTAPSLVPRFRSRTILVCAAAIMPLSFLAAGRLSAVADDVDSTVTASEPSKSKALTVEESKNEESGKSSASEGSKGEDSKKEESHPEASKDGDDSKDKDSKEDSKDEKPKKAPSRPEARDRRLRHHPGASPVRSSPLRHQPGRCLACYAGSCAADG